MVKIRRPFHETIVDVIRTARGGFEFSCLAQLIMATKIPKDHDKIIAAWKEILPNPEGSIVADAIADLLEQKKEVEVEAQAKIKTLTASSWFGFASPTNFSSLRTTFGYGAFFYYIAGK